MKALNTAIFGIIAVSLNVGIVSIFVFMQFKSICILTSTLLHFGNCINFFGQENHHPLPTSPKVPACLCL